MTSIRNSLLRGQVAMILLLGGAIMATTFFGAASAVRSVSSSLIRGAVDRVESELGGFFGPIDGSLYAVEGWTREGLIRVDDPQALNRLLLPLLEQLTQVSAVALTDELGNECQLIRGEDDVPGVRNRLVRLEEWGERVQWLDWRSGREPEVGWSGLIEDPRSRRGFSDAVALLAAGEQRVHWTEPYVVSTSGQLGITAALALQSADRSLVISFDLLLEDLSEFASSIDISENGTVSLLTGDARLIAYPDDPRFWAGDDPSGWMLQTPTELESPLIDDLLAALAERPPEQRGTPLRFGSDGETWWAQVRPYALAPDRDLLIAALVPNADLLTDRALLRRLIVGVTLVFLLGAVLRASLFARSFSRPIESLVRSNERISQGDLDAGEPVVTRLVEVRSLADAQERMRSGLKTLMKLERDLQLARQIQQRTFPQQLPKLAGFEVVGWSRPADETGGDTYDVIGLSGSDGHGRLSLDRADRAVLLLADASGHGIGPALSVTQLRAMVRMAVRTGQDLSTVAGFMNDQLHADLPPNRFITAWLAEIDSRDGSVTWISAGQGPLMIYQASSGRVEFLPATGPPLGLFGNLTVRVEGPRRLRPGDVFAVLSDGFFEAARSDGEEIGRERLAAILAEHHEAGAGQILDALRESIDAWTDRVAAIDDRTAIIVKRTARPEREDSRAMQMVRLATSRMTRLGSDEQEKA